MQVIHVMQVMQMLQLSSAANDSCDANVAIIAGEFDLSVWHLTNSRSNSKREYIWDSSVILDA